MQNSLKQNEKLQRKKKTNKTKKETKTDKSHAKNFPLYSHAKLYASKITSTKSTLSQTSPSFVGTSSSDERHSPISPSPPPLPTNTTHSPLRSSTNTPSTHHQTSNIKQKKRHSQIKCKYKPLKNDLKTTKKQSKNKNRPNYTSENALQYLQTNITKQQTLYSKFHKKLPHLPQNAFVLLKPHRFGTLYLNEKTNKIHVRMNKTSLFLTTQEQRQMQTYYQEPNHHHSKTHNYANPSKHTILRCPSPLCYYNIINTTNITKHVYTHCFLFHKQTPLTYEYKKTMIGYKSNINQRSPPSKTQLNKNLSTLIPKKSMIYIVRKKTYFNSKCLPLFYPYIL